jgi:hypothetical protein
MYSQGQIGSKNADLDAHKSGRFKFAKILPSEQQIQLNDGFS